MLAMATVNKTNLGNRVTKARQASVFAHVTRKGKNAQVAVPGTDGKTYDIIFKWMTVNDVTVLQGECRVNCGIGYKDCKGASASVCYHTVAGALAMARDTGTEIAICHNRRDAERLSNIEGGRVFAIRSKKSQRVVWVVAS